MLLLLYKGGGSLVSLVMDTYKQTGDNSRYALRNAQLLMYLRQKGLFLATKKRGLELLYSLSQKVLYVIS